MTHPPCHRESRIENRESLGIITIYCVDFSIYDLRWGGWEVI